MCLIIERGKATTALSGFLLVIPPLTLIEKRWDLRSGVKEICSSQLKQKLYFCIQATYLNHFCYIQSEVYIVQLFGVGGWWKKTCTFGEKWGRKPVLGDFLLILVQKFAVLNIFRKIIA